MRKDVVFLWSMLTVIAGVFWGSFFSVPMWADFFLFLAFVSSLFCVFPKKEIVVVGCLGAVWYMVALYTVSVRIDALAVPVFGEKITGEARVFSDPEERDTFRQVVLSFEQCQGTECPKKRVLWQAPLIQTMEAGERMLFSCQLEQPKNFSPSFDYRMFLAKEGIGYICQHAEKSERLPDDMFGRIWATFYVPKHIFERALSKILSEPESGLAKGLLLGGDQYLPAALKADFTRIGLTHMIAVSGYNITLIVQGMLAIGLFLGMWRRQAVWIALVGIVFFIIMIGVPASAARAGAMALLVFGAFQMGRLTRPLPILLFAAAVMLLFHPLLLRYDLGFQLSFLATLGIIVAEPYQQYISPSSWLGKSFFEILFITFVVELFVLPIILFSFHTFSPLIFIGNFLVILVPFAMAGSFLTVFSFLLLPGVHILFSWFSFAILSLMTHSVEWLGSLTYASITITSFGMKSLVLWYALLFLMIVFLQHFFYQYGYETKK